MYGLVQPKMQLTFWCALTMAVLACQPSGAQFEYFPLQVGNRWIYEQSYYREILTFEDGKSYWRDRFDSNLHSTVDNTVVSDTVIANLQLTQLDYELIQNEYVLSVIGRREIANNFYFEFNTGQLIRWDSDGTIRDYSEINRQETILFDFRQLKENPHAMISTGTLAPFMPYSFGFPSRDLHPEPLNTYLGSIANTVGFGFGDGIFYCGLLLGPGIGVVAGGCGSDVFYEAIGYKITRAVIAGKDIITSVTPSVSWGVLKEFQRW